MYFDDPNCILIILKLVLCILCVLCVVTEAEYAYRLQKPIVPLRLEPRYIADGWLGALAGNKLYFDFSVPEKFEKSMKSVIKELGPRGKRSGSGEGDGGTGRTVKPQAGKVEETPPFSHLCKAVIVACFTCLYQIFISSQIPLKTSQLPSIFLKHE